MAQFNSLLVTGDSRFLNPINGNARNGVYSVVGTQTAATGAWTGVIPIPALYDGLSIDYYLPYAGVSGTNVTLNLTLADGTTKTGAKNVYLSTGRLTTQYGAGRVIQMTYFSAGSISISGTATTDDRWICDAYYDTNDKAVNVARNSSIIKAGSVGIYRYTFVMENSDGRWESIVTSSSNGTGKARNTHGFKLDEVLLMYANYDYVENATPTSAVLYCFYTSLADARYSFNVANNATYGLTAGQYVYLVGAINSTDGLFYLDSTWWTQTLPSIEDGKLYIRLGLAYDYYRMQFFQNNPIFQYIGGKLRRYIPDTAINGYTIEKSVPSNAVFTDQNVNQADGASSNNDYKLLFEDTSGSGNVVSGTRKTQYLVYNPSTRKLKIGITNPNEYGTLETDDITAQQINGVSLGNSPKFTDQAVQQLSGGNNVDYQVLFEDTSGSGEITSGTRKHSGLVYNPNTSTLTSTNISATSISSTSLAATTITGSTLNGQTIPASPVFTDQAVQQLEGGNNTAYELLYEDTASSGDTTSGTRKSQNLTYNPVSNTLTLAGKVDCTSMSVTTPTYTLNKTSGTWNVGSVSAKRTGNVVQMTIIVKGTGTGVTCGTDGFVGSLTGTGPAPAQDMTLVSYTGNFTIMGYIDTSRKLWIRPIGSGTYTAGNNSIIQVDGMFICE